MALLTIGGIAAACSVKIDTVRYYEKRGLLEPISRTSVGYRLYNDKSVSTLKFIKHAQYVGFSLEEIKSLIIISFSRKNICNEVKQKVQEKITILERKERELMKMKKALEGIKRDCSKVKNEGQHCPFLEQYRLQERV